MGRPTDQAMARVLIIDDDEHVREMCKSILEEEGFEVETAPDGDAGIRLFHERPAAVVLCDIYMPKKDGIETIVELRREYHGLHIIAISGGDSGKVSMISAARRLGADATLPKPFGASALVEAVRAAVAEPE